MRERREQPDVLADGCDLVAGKVQRGDRHHPLCPKVLYIYIYIYIYIYLYIYIYIFIYIQYINMYMHNVHADVLADGCDRVAREVQRGERHHPLCPRVSQSSQTLESCSNFT